MGISKRLTVNRSAVEANLWIRQIRHWYVLHRENVICLNKEWELEYTGLDDKSHLSHYHHFWFSRFMTHNHLIDLLAGYLSWKPFILSWHVDFVTSLHKFSSLQLPELKSLNQSFFLNTFSMVYVIIPTWQPVHMISLHHWKTNKQTKKK